MVRSNQKIPSYFFLPVAWVVFFAAGLAAAFAGDDFPVDFAFFISQ
jgi:hypothetical protein